MRTTPSKQQLYGHWASKPRSLGYRAHEVLMRLAPDYEVRPAWRGIGYKWGSNYSVVVSPYEDHIKLMLWRGIELPDPARALQGTGSNTRHLRIGSNADLNPDVLGALLNHQRRIFASGKPAERRAVPRHAKAIPRFVSSELDARGLRQAYDERPAYQQRDYVSWISGAKREPTQLRRLEQMLEELETGNVYMNMPWKRGKK